jgi:hypothetical protein
MFGDWAERLADNGYSPIPLTGKRPAIKGWNGGKLLLSTLDKLASSMPDHNIGVLTGSLIALDIDCTDPVLAAEIAAKGQELIGPTEYVRVGRWPKRVLFYRQEDFELNRVLTVRVGTVEVLGQGSQVAIAGIHPSTMKPYYWPDQSLLDCGLEQIPICRASDLQQFISWAADRQGLCRPLSSYTKLKPESSSTKSVVGGRNNSLFRAIVQLGQEVATRDELFIRAQRLNRRFPTALSDAEVTSIVNSVWSYKEQGKLFAKGRQQIIVPINKDQAIELARSPGASALLMVLKATRSTPVFRIPQRSTARLLGWGMGK